MHGRRCKCGGEAEVCHGSRHARALLTASGNMHIAILVKSHVTVNMACTVFYELFYEPGNCIRFADLLRILFESCLSRLLPCSASGLTGCRSGCSSWRRIRLYGEYISLHWHMNAPGLFQFLVLVLVKMGLRSLFGIGDFTDVCIVL